VRAPCGTLRPSLDVILSAYIAEKTAWLPWFSGLDQCSQPVGLSHAITTGGQENTGKTGCLRLQSAELFC
jgi:hypothetical protein